MIVIVGTTMISLGEPLRGVGQRQKCEDPVNRRPTVAADPARDRQRVASWREPHGSLSEDIWHVLSRTSAT